MIAVTVSVNFKKQAQDAPDDVADSRDASILGPETIWYFSETLQITAWINHAAADFRSFCDSCRRI
jgi:hypothetical protein